MKGWLRIVLLAASLVLQFENAYYLALAAALFAGLVGISIERDLRAHLRRVERLQEMRSR